MTDFVYECISKDGVNEFIVKIADKERRMSIPCNVTNNEIICNFLISCLKDYNLYLQTKLEFAAIGLPLS